MNNWKNKKLGKVCDVRDGTHDSPKYHDTGIPFITSKNLTDKGVDFTNVNFIKKEDHISFSKRSHVENGDILFGMIGTVGNPVIVNEKFEFSIKNVALLKFSEVEELLNTFALQVLKSSIIEDQFRTKSDGGVQSFVSLSTIRNLDFPIPAKSIQTKIALILTTIDHVIEKTAEAIAKYEAIKQGVMHDLFTRGIGADGQLRPSYQDAPELYKESALGWIPKEWEVCYLKKYVEIQGGYAFPSIDYTKYGTQLIRIGNLFENKLSLHRDPVYLPSSKINLFTQFILKEGDIIMSMTGTNGKRDYGFAVRIKNKNALYFLNQRVCKFTYKSSVEPNFLLNLLHTELYLKPIYSSAGGTKQANLNSKNILEVYVPIPNKMEQLKISARLDSLQKLKTRENFLLGKLKLSKQGLMQDLLTGKVPVKADLINA